MTDASLALALFALLYAGFLVGLLLGHLFPAHELPNPHDLPKPADEADEPDEDDEPDEADEAPEDPDP